MTLRGVRELALPGVRLAELERHADERGLFHELIRADWAQLLGGDQILQANLSVTLPGVVRAWHRHLRGQVDYFFVARGYAKVCACDDTTGTLVEVVLSGDKPQILRVPGHYWHGFKALGHEPVYLVYFTNRLYDYQNPDEERRPWKDPAVIPRTINGRADDPRAGKPWDWFHPPHR
jgi:dTDP-4-dehydrorhamnose 3,5-epimerase